MNARVGEGDVGLSVLRDFPSVGLTLDASFSTPRTAFGEILSLVPAGA